MRNSLRLFLVFLPIICLTEAQEATQQQPQNQLLLPQTQQPLQQRQYYPLPQNQQYQQYRANQRQPGRGRPFMPPEEDPIDGIVSTCPEPYGFFADASQCDKYYECIEGEMKEKLCPDGLVFDGSRSDIEKCELQHLVDCSDRPDLQPAKPSINCPRKNGYYAHNDSRICDKFFHCTEGRPHIIICPDGLVFSNKTATCSFRTKEQESICVFIAPEMKNVPDNLDKVFQCPRTKTTFGGDAHEVAHPLYPDPNDCQFYYICIDGTTPRRSGCEIGQVFSEKTGICTSPKFVSECKDWYIDVLDYDEDGEVATTTTTTPKPKPKPKPRPGVTGPKRRGKPPVEIPRTRAVTGTEYSS